MSSLRGRWLVSKMAGQSQQDFNRSALTIGPGRVMVENLIELILTPHTLATIFVTAPNGIQAWYTGQKAERIPSGLVRVVGSDCVSVDLSYNELTSVSGVKDFLKLEELILDNNSLRDLKTLPRIPTLTTLSLNNNKLSDIDGVLQRIRECCPKLVYVSLLGNPGCPDQLTDPTSTDEDDYERYRLYAIHCLPQTLRFLDSRPITNVERQNARSRGKFLRTVKFAADRSTYTRPVDEFDDVHFNVNYTPLPSSMRNPQDHKGAFGKCRYRYSGKNSEGNRFISNNDL